MAGYGSFRRSSGHSDSAQNEMGSSLGRVLSLFREDVSLADAISWLKAQDYRERRGAGSDPKSKVTGQPVDSLVTQALALLNDDLFPALRSASRPRKEEPHSDGPDLQPLRLLEVNADGLLVEVKVSDTQTRKLPMKSLSDGYRTALALVLDLFQRVVRHCQYHRPNAPYFERGSDGSIRIRGPGIVLIDEVDAHLHIAWQQKIGFWLKRRFPDLQFLITTHSPFICQAAEEDGLIRLNAPSESGAPLTLLAGDERFAILNGELEGAATSSLFGLERTRSEQAERLYQQVAALEAKVARLRASPEEAALLRELAQKMPRDIRLELEGLLARRERQA